MPIKQDIAQQLSGKWQIGLFEAPCKAPISWCYGCCCSCCMAAQQRNEILDVIGEPYICCGGLFPCGPLGDPQDKNCVYLEACCCTGMAISANRFYIQTRFDRENTACDDCILWTVCLASWAVCILQCFMDVPDEIENCVDCMIMTVDGCMLAQQQVEIEHVKKTGFSGAPTHLNGVMSEYQQELMKQGRPSPGMAAAAMAGGAMAGGAGAAAAMGMQKAPAPQTMGFVSGFMFTKAPNGQQWSQYCSQQPVTDSQGFVAGHWGECLAWAKVYEIQNPNWSSDPTYQANGPCGQVIEAMLNSGPPHMRQTLDEAAAKLEAACEQAASNGQPLPIIRQRALG